VGHSSKSDVIGDGAELDTTLAALIEERLAAISVMDDGVFHLAEHFKGVGTRFRQLCQQRGGEGTVGILQRNSVSENIGNSVPKKAKRGLLSGDRAARLRLQRHTWAYSSGSWFFLGSGALASATGAGDRAGRTPPWAPAAGLPA